MSTKVCIATGTRADYGLFYPLLKEIRAAKGLTLQIIVTGMHLSPEFGLTYREIEQDGFSIDEKVEMLLSSDTPTGVSKSTGLGIMGIADAIERLKPDILVLLGDRFETFAAAVAAMHAGIPIAHLNGGESTVGAVDEAMRHSITKMSHLHFTSTKQYKKRVVQLGERPASVHAVGALGIDNIKHTRLLAKKSVMQKLPFKKRKTNLMVTFHPATLEGDTSGARVTSLLEALDSLRDTGIIFTMPNADTHGRVIARLIEQYVAENPDKCAAFSSMGRVLYLSALNFVDAVVGNSSSGIIEAPSFGIPTVDIGLRQTGRIRAASVLHCGPDARAIRAALGKALSPAFRRKCRTVKNPYGSGDAAKRIVRVLKSARLSPQTLMKTFYDIKY